MMLHISHVIQSDKILQLYLIRTPQVCLQNIYPLVSAYRYTLYYSHHWTMLRYLHITDFRQPNFTCFDLYAAVLIICGVLFSAVLLTLELRESYSFLPEKVSIRFLQALLYAVCFFQPFITDLYI